MGRSAYPKAERATGTPLGAAGYQAARRGLGRMPEWDTKFALLVDHKTPPADQEKSRREWEAGYDARIAEELHDTGLGL